MTEAKATVKIVKDVPSKKAIRFDLLGLFCGLTLVGFWLTQADLDLGGRIVLAVAGVGVGISAMGLVNDASLRVQYRLSNLQKSDTADSGQD